MARRCQSKHRKMWVIGSPTAGYLYWCQECGAIRWENQPTNKWIYPAGPDGENPALTK